MADMPQTVAALREAAEVFERNMTPELARTYLDALGALDDSHAAQTVKSLIRTSRRMPRPAEIIEAARARPQVTPAPGGDMELAYWWCSDVRMMRDGNGCGWKSDGPEEPPEGRCPMCGNVLRAIHARRGSNPPKAAGR